MVLPLTLGRVLDPPFWKAGGSVFMISIERSTVKDSSKVINHGVSTEYRVENAYKTHLEG